MRDVVTLKSFGEPVMQNFLALLIGGALRNSRAVEISHKFPEVEFVLVRGDRVPLEQLHNVVGKPLREALFL